MNIFGTVIDNETRSIHYHTEKEIIANLPVVSVIILDINAMKSTYKMLLNVDIKINFIRMRYFVDIGNMN